MSKDLVEIERKITNLEKDLLELKKLRSIIMAKDFKAKYACKSPGKYHCYQCKTDFQSARSLERHGWEQHPSNDYEKAWANTDWDNWKGSSYYEDDPYY